MHRACLLLYSVRGNFAERRRNLAYAEGRDCVARRWSHLAIPRLSFSSTSSAIVRLNRTYYYCLRLYRSLYRSSTHRLVLRSLSARLFSLVVYSAPRIGGGYRLYLLRTQIERIYERYKHPLSRVSIGRAINPYKLELLSYRLVMVLV